MMIFGARLSAVFLALVCVALAGGSSPARAELVETGLSDHWKLISDRDGISVYMRHGEDSRLKTFRGVMRMPLSDEYALVALLDDHKSVPRWMHFIDGAEELSRVSPLDRSMRFTTEAPWPLKDREAVVRTRVDQNILPDSEHITVRVSNQGDLIPPNPNYVRFPEIEGMFKIQRLGDGQVEITYEVVMDPGGYVPVWLANLILRDAPFYTLQKLRRLLNSGEYANRYLDFVEVFGPGRPDALPAPRSYLYGNPPDEPLHSMTLEMMNPAQD